MTSWVESIHDDCVQWTGYKPCPVQKEQGFFDCTDCVLYEPDTTINDNICEPFGPDKLVSASSVGVIEMGGLGSILRTSAVTRAVKELNPNARIVWFTHSRGCELLKYVPGVMPVNSEAQQPDACGEIVGGLDVVLNFETDSDIARSIVSLARCVGGFGINQADKFVGVMPHAEKLQRVQVDDTFRRKNRQTMQELLLESVGLAAEPAQYDVMLDKSNIQAAKFILGREFENQYRTIVGLNIGSSQKGIVKRWPVDSFVRLAHELSASDREIGLAILSGPEEEDLRDEVEESIQSTGLANVKVLPKGIEIGNFMAIIGELDGVVTADTFAFHVAKAVGTPAVALAGPTPHNELEVGAGDVVIGPKLACSPCFGRCVRNIIGECMSAIGVNEVLEASKTVVFRDRTLVG